MPISDHHANKKGGDLMGLFSRKSSEPKTSTQPKKQQINADDIWNTPVKRAGGDTAFVKESSSDKVHAEKITDTIEPETIRSKMEQLEKELAEKKNDPVKTYADYDVNPVGQAEITDAQSEYEKLYEEEHARFVASHKEDISVASVEGIDSKLEEIYRIHDEKVRPGVSTTAMPSVETKSMALRNRRGYSRLSRIRTSRNRRVFSQP